MKLIYCLALLLLFSNNIHAQNTITIEEHNQWSDEDLMRRNHVKTTRDSFNAYLKDLKFCFEIAPVPLYPNDKYPGFTSYKFKTGFYRFNHLCEKIILISQRISISAISEEAHKNYVIGVSLMNDPANNKKEDNYLSLLKLLDANILAPWWADVYKQLGLANELAENYDEAIRNFKLYLLTKPSAKEARKVHDEIYIIEEKQIRGRN